MGEVDGGGSWIHSLCCRILKAGHIPKHVALIMDGNRRFAQKMQYSRTFQGHVLGFDKLMETLKWCLNLGITELTVYAFSIENFKRPKEEVDGLMELAKQKVTKLLDKRYVHMHTHVMLCLYLIASCMDSMWGQVSTMQDKCVHSSSVVTTLTKYLCCSFSDLIMKYGVCIRVLGDLQLLPRDVLESVARAVNLSRNNDQAFLNVCFSYTSRNEMAEAVRRLTTGAQEGMILPRLYYSV